jgi:hypothetical protein
VACTCPGDAIAEFSANGTVRGKDRAQAIKDRAQAIKDRAQAIKDRAQAITLCPYRCMEVV